MAKVTTSLKLDKDIKEKAQALAKELGLPLSTIVNANLREFVRTGEAKFSLEPKIKPEVWEELKKATDDYKAGRNISPAFSSADELIEYLGL